MAKIKKFLFSNYEFIFCIILFAIILQVALNPTPYIDATLSGLMVFAKIVLPSLFCFFFLTKIFMKMNSSTKLFSPIGKIFSKIYNLPQEAGYIFCMSVISGYPVGAKLLSEFYEKGAIDKDEAKKMLGLCSTSGPMFIIGSMSHIIGRSDMGLIILISHIVSTLINGLIYSRFNFSKINKNLRKNHNNSEFLIKNDENTSKIDKIFIKNEKILNKNVNFKNYNDEYKNNNLNKDLNKNEEIKARVKSKIDINAIMYDTILSVFMVGGFITLCFTFISFIGQSTVFRGLRQIATNFTGSDVVFGIFSGVIEMTSGCIAIGGMALGKISLVCILCAIVTFGGLSIHLQSNIFLSKIGIKYKYFLLTKLTQTLLSIIICIPLCLVI